MNAFNPAHFRAQFPALADAGATSTETANSAIGGNVSFRPKSADDYLRPGKTSAFGYRSGYDSADRSWHSSWGDCSLSGGG